MHQSLWAFRTIHVGIILDVQGRHGDLLFHGGSSQLSEPFPNFPIDSPYGPIERAIGDEAVCAEAGDHQSVIPLKRFRDNGELTIRANRT
ncbi:hypothetical protein DM872_10565 [Pseudomonas taiwanensis]|nr:hypothetical protein [Pseudomonas taiwanensis]